MGEVVLQVMVDRQGKARHVRVESSNHEEFTQAARTAIAEWEFSPGIRRGVVSNARVRVPMRIVENPEREQGIESISVLDNFGAESDQILDVPQQLKRFVRPVYPFHLLADLAEGSATVEYVVGISGRPEQIKLVEATAPAFGNSLLAVLPYWLYEPGRRGGRPTPVRITQRITFSPDDVEEEFRFLAAALADGDNSSIVMPAMLDRPVQVDTAFRPEYQGLELDYGEEDSILAVVRAVVTSEGRVVLPWIVSSPDPLSGYVAATALTFWSFEPPVFQRSPANTIVEVPFRFSKKSGVPLDESILPQDDLDDLEDLFE